MTTTNKLRLILLLLCVATALMAATSCSKDNGRPVQDPGGFTTPKPLDYYFSRVRFFKDHRQPATDTVWTLHLVTQQLVDQYTNQDGYIYAETSTYQDMGTLWTR